MHDRKIDEYRNSVKTKAIVIDKLYGDGKGRRPHSGYKYPQYSFRYNDTNFITADRNVYARNLSIGDSVTVIFRKDNPGDAVVYKFISYWVSLPHILVGLLIAAFFPFTAIVIGEYIEFKKNPDEYDQQV